MVLKLIHLRQDGGCAWVGGCYQVFHTSGQGYTKELKLMDTFCCERFLAKQTLDLDLHCFGRTMTYIHVYYDRTMVLLQL